MKLPKFGKFGRYAFCIVLVAAIFLLYEFRLFQWQVLEGEKFEQESLSDRTDVIELDAARGPILDRNGKVLAGNRTTYDVVFNALNMASRDYNATILKITDLLEERGEKWRDVLPILVDENGEYQFVQGKDEEIAALKEDLNLAEYATAEQCISEMADWYGCKGFSTEDTRTVASVRYSMSRDGFSRTSPYVVAQDVSVETVGIISQRAGELKGVEPKVSVARYYGEDSALAPQVIGQVGVISGEQYEEAEKNGTAYNYKTNISGYKWTDSLGLYGLESAFEKQLRGSRGEETIYTDDTGAVKGKAVTTQPKEGNAVHTTLDSDLQRVADLSLKKNIEGNTLARSCTSGAAVALDVDDFGVLACANYPNYDLNEYFEKYDELLADKRQPLYNKALLGEYTPGSIFKPLVALAALQEGTVGADYSVNCGGTFDYYDLHLGCLNDVLGPKNMYSAIAESCNVYFCTVGIELGIAKIDAYAEYLGLGEKTGVELEENTGVIANPQDYKKWHGDSWTGGVTANAAIGQSDNKFTPIQLATYCATIANGGKRLRTHFLSKITDYTGQETIEEYKPQEVLDAGLSPDVLDVVKQGMIGTATYGTASDVFEGYPVSVACKTGTAETSEHPELGGTEANISIICFAPAEDPEIAVAVMLEYGNKGDYAKKVAKDILDQYFGFYTWDEEGNRYDSDGNLVDDEGKVLKTKEEVDAEKEQKEKQEQEDFLSSALGGSSQGESGASSQGQGVPAEPSPGPDASQGSERGDIPTVPFTGETSSAPEGGSSPEPGTSRPESSSSGGKPDSPYYSGDG